MKSSLLLFLSIFSLIAQADFNKGVYGEDNRLDFIELTNSQHINWSLSTAAMISKFTAREEYDNPEVYRIRSKMLSQGGVCEYERFARQLTAADCSGFIINEDTLVTAGHCIRHEQDCKDFYWIFDYRSGDGYQIGRTLKVSSSKVYSCKSIVKSVNNPKTGLDFAIIKLDRPVLDREPLKLRKKGHIQQGEKVLVAGYPSGLPLKVATDGTVRDENSSQPYFIATTDSFVGNSGSAVINEETGLVEGILVRGDEDYVYRKEKGKRCLVPAVCAEDECDGEEITKISELLKYL
ncbi:MAG: hypothetical protein BM556_16000 [Bacteriovorax sp. MedPE-SWde]|nr:MAG: hypothetical protein BM556_16000 [Bacteriovorax sp. MedPE-SWde]